MRRTLFVLLVVLVGSGVGCKKKEGPTGPAGPEGPQGPPGPVADPPRIQAVSPGWGSWRSTVTITGENFSDTATNNLVYFDGTLANVTSASTTELVVEPVGLDPDASKIVDITVMTSNQASNAFAWEALASGTVRAVGALPFASVWDPVDVVMGPGDSTLYVADQRAGVLAIERATGKTTLLHPLSVDDLRRPLAIAYHPVADTVWVADDRSFAGDGSLVRILEIDPATGDSSVVVFTTTALANTVDMTFSGNGDAFVLRDEPPAATERIAFIPADLSTVDGNFATMLADTNPSEIVVDDDTNELHMTATATDDIYTVSSMAGGAASAELLLIDGVAGMVLSGMDEVQVIQTLGANPGVKTVDLAMGMVTDYNTFTYPFAWDDTRSMAIAAGGELYWLGSGQDAVEMFAVIEAPNAATHRALTAGLNSGFITLLNYNGAVYWDSLVCVTANGAAGFGLLMRGNADGSAEVASRGSCGVGLAASANAIFATHFTAAEVRSIDPANGNFTTVLDTGDGLLTPAGTLVEGNNLFVIDLGTDAIGRSDLTGGGFNGTFATPASGYTGVTSNGTAYLADLVNGGVTTFDTTSGGALSPLTPGTLGGIADIELLPDGTLVASAFDSGTVYEVQTDGSTQVLRDAGDDNLLINPTTVHQLPDGSYLMIDIADPLGEIALVAP